MTWFPPVHAYEVYLLLSIQVLKTCMPNLRLFQFSNSRWEIVCKLADILIKKLFHSYFHHCWNVLMKDWLLAFVLLALIRGDLIPQMIVWNTATNVTWTEHQSKLSMMALVALNCQHFQSTKNSSSCHWIYGYIYPQIKQNKWAYNFLAWTKHCSRLCSNPSSRG